MAASRFICLEGVPFSSGMRRGPEAAHITLNPSALAVKPSFSSSPPKRSENKINIMTEKMSKKSFQYRSTSDYFPTMADVH